MLSRSALAQTYGNIKAKTSKISPSIGSAKRGLPFLHRARNARIHFKPRIDFFSCLQLRGWKPSFKPTRLFGEVSLVPSKTVLTLRSPMLLPPWNRWRERYRVSPRRPLSWRGSSGIRNNPMRCTNQIPVPETRRRGEWPARD